MDEQKYKEVEVECIECGEMVTMKVYDKVDETDKEMILSHSLNQCVCPNCNTIIHMYPPVLYTDLSHHLAVVMDSWEELFQFKKSIEEADQDENGTDSDEISEMYYVDNEDDLITVIMCVDNNLDYQVTKLLIYTLKNEYMEEHPDEIVDYLSLGDHRNKKGELLISMFDASGKEKIYKPFPMDRYQEYLTLYKDKLEKANIFVMNDTASEFFFDHLDDIDKGSREIVKLYNVLVGDCVMFLATSSLDGVKEGDMVTFIQKKGYEVSGECVCVQDIDTISIGRELSLLENISDYYTEGGYC